MDDVTILIVEDDAIAQLTFLQYLRDLGYEKVITVNNGHDAVKSIQNESFDLAFLDIRIRGDIDGIATAKLIKEKIPLLPLIFLTASTDRYTIHQALACQPYSIIHKPYDLTILKESIDGALNYKVHHEEVNQLNQQHMLDQILEKADVGICITNAKGEFVKVNKAFCSIYGYSEQELIGQHFASLLPENIRNYAITLHQDYLAGHTEESSGEWKALDKLGNQKDVYMTVDRLTSEEGRRFKITTINDISQRKSDVQKLTKALDDKDTYAREIHHRVKNNMNIMSGLLYLQAEKVKDQDYVYNLFQESISRIKTLSIIHEQLYRHDNYTYIDLKEYIRSLVNNVKSMFQNKAQEVRLIQKVVSIPLDVDKAIACGLVVNELLSNSFKYAFAEPSPASCINVNAYPEENNIHIIINDNGIGLPDEFQLEKNTTLGFQLISNLSQQLNGTIQLSSKNGTRIHLQFPR